MTDSPDGLLLRRVERRSLWLAALATGGALVAPGGGLPIAAGILGGALLSVLSYWAIKRSVSALADRLAASNSRDTQAVPQETDASGPPPTEAPASRGLVMFVWRHALLAGMAYVMIARLRLPPVALLGGASVIVLAAAAEVLHRPRPH
ncbi:MAG: hypothetical protein ABI634_01055 [Acidobacteriota bacterium]